MLTTEQKLEHRRRRREHYADGAAIASTLRSFAQELHDAERVVRGLIEGDEGISEQKQRLHEIARSLPLIAEQVNNLSHRVRDTNEWRISAEQESRQPAQASA